MRRRTVTLIVLLEVYALILSITQYLGGLRTDEAKYLLNIPYPHPPLLRSLMGWTASVPGQEFLWRFLLASALLQMLWFYVDLGSVLTPARRRALLLAWLFSSAILQQGGTIMMSIPVACFAVVFTWSVLRPIRLSASGASVLGLAWLTSLFIAYQSILFAPIVFVSLQRSRLRFSQALFFFATPILLLALYTATNPLAVASMLNVAGQTATVASILTLARDTALIVLLGGSAVLVLTGIIGLLTSRRFDLVLTFAFVLGYTAISTQQYYAILFTPLLVAGTFLLLCKRKLRPSFLAMAHVLTAFFAALMLWPTGDRPLLARETMDALHAVGITGTVIIDGPYGHEWQYEANDIRIRRYTDMLSLDTENEASAFICTATDCADHVDTTKWVRLDDAPVQTWIRRQ